MLRLSPSSRQLAALAGDHGRQSGGCGSPYTVAIQNNGEGPPLRECSVEGFARMLETCRKSRDRAQALQLYACMPVCVVTDHAKIANQLIAVLVDARSIQHARHVFDRLSHRDASAWSSLIIGYVRHEEWQHALTLYQSMQKETSLHPSDYAFVCLLKACTGLKDLEIGSELHAAIASEGLLKANLYIGSALIEMYAKCSSLSKAQEVLHELPNRDVVVWTTLITGYVDHGKAEEALLCVNKMKSEGVSPNTRTLVCIAKACGSLKATKRGQEIHTEITMKGFESEAIVGRALLSMYATCGLLETAKVLLYKLPVRNVIAWTAMIDGYAAHGYGEEALNCLEQMQHESVASNAHTFACSVKACCSFGVIEKGQELHMAIMEKGFDSNVRVGSIMVTMYVQSGMLAEAQSVFDKLPVRDSILWSALIAGYSQVGESRNAISTFNKMVGECMKPELGTFVIVLNAFNHEGGVEKGLRFFEAIQSDYGVTPTLEHYTTVVDLLGRSGHLIKAISLVEHMPYHPDYVSWCIVLSSCQNGGDMKVARYAFENAVKLKGGGMGVFVCLRNIYADAAMYDEANEVEAMWMQNQGWEKHEEDWDGLNSPG